MKVKKIPAIMVVCFSGLIFWLATAKATLVNSSTTIQDGIEYYIQTDKAVYDLGQEVEIRYRITNLTDQQWQVGGVTPGWMIFVAPKGAEWFDGIWEWAEPGPPGPTGLRLQPNEFMEISEMWPQINMQGTPHEPGDDIQIPPGIYRITACLKLTDTNVAVDVTIVPEPTSMALFLAGMSIFIAFDRKRRC
jgi:hypothetical protein